MKKFFDTSSLLLLENITEPIVISSITVQELEDIKSSARKDEDVRAAARKVLHWLDNNADMYEIVIFNNHML
jgi:hypothetical protein